MTDRIHGIFLPYQFGKRAKAKESAQRFSHYTSVEAASKILTNAQVWFRKSSVMNDFSEIEFGLACLNAAWFGAHGLKLKSLLNRMFSGSSERIETMFSEQLPEIRANTYLTCISEHQPDENEFGRLSMWRAYGNIALVLNPQIFMVETADALQSFSNPVDYHTVESFEAMFAGMVDRVEYDFDYLKSFGEEQVWDWVLFTMRQYVLCTKHKGFGEELEWRVIHVPSPVSSPLISKEVEVVRGVAQPVVKLSLTDRPELGIHGLSIPSFIERIIIGPTQYQHVQREAFISLLSSRGVFNASERVVTSNIPLRNFS